MAVTNISDLMIKNQLYYVYPGTSLPTVIGLLRDQRIRHLPVVDSKHNLVSVISAKDVFEYLSLADSRDMENLLWLDTKHVQDLNLTSEPIYAHSEEDIEEVIEKYIKNDLGIRIGFLPIVRSESSKKLVGVFSVVDVLKKTPRFKRAIELETLHAGDIGQEWDEVCRLDEMTTANAGAFEFLTYRFIAITKTNNGGEEELKALLEDVDLFMMKPNEERVSHGDMFQYLNFHLKDIHPRFPINHNTNAKYAINHDAPVLNSKNLVDDTSVIGRFISEKTGIVGLYHRIEAVIAFENSVPTRLITPTTIIEHLVGR